MNKPNFFIIGAPKCGTTSLASWLGSHPQVFMSPIKEPHFFAEDNYRYVSSTRQYGRLFRGAKPHHRAIGEASTWYLSSATAIDRIEEFTDRARYIVCLRNPIEMAPSLHEQEYFAVNEDVASFEEAWRLIPKRRAGQCIPHGCRNVRHLFYDEACSLGSQVERLLGKVDRERVLFILLDDLSTDARREYLRVLSFLGLEDDGRTTFPRLNSAKEPTSVLAKRAIQLGIKVKHALGIYRSFGTSRLVTRTRPRSGVSPDLERELCDRFSEEIDKLEFILGKNFGSWRKAEQPRTRAG